MVNPVSQGAQSYTTVQPSFTSGAEARANTEQVQPRQAPAADSQRSDAREFSSRDDQSASSAPLPKNAAQQPVKTDSGDRGQIVNLSV